MKPGHWAALGAAALLTTWLITRVIGGGATGGFGAPPRQAVPEDGGGTMADPHPDHPVFCQPEGHPGEVVFTRHRYPAAVGGEITAAIHRGWSPMRVPARTPGAQWIVAPPSEEGL